MKSDSRSAGAQSKRSFSSQRTGRAAEKIVEYLIESPQAVESGRERDLGHGHLGFVNQLLGKKNATGLCDRDGGSAQVLDEQPPQMAFTDAQPRSQCIHTRVVAVESSICDESQRARDGVGGSAPRRKIGSALGTAPQARAKASFHRGRRRREEAAVLEFRRSRRADRTAENSGGRYAYQDQPVKTRVPALQRAIGDLFVRQFHTVLRSQFARG